MRRSHQRRAATGSKCNKAGFGDVVMIGKSILTSLLRLRLHHPVDHPLLQWPGLCQLCRLPTGDALCSVCVQRFSAPKMRCRTCAIPTPESTQLCGACQRKPPPLTRCTAAIDYTYPWTTFIQDFKFRHCLGWARLFSDVMFRHPTAQDILNKTDYLVPIPSSHQRIRERGYDHLRELLCNTRQEIAPTIWLQRLHQTTPQHRSSRDQRLTLDKHALIIPSHLRPLLRGSKVTLVDDVMTTGATLYATADALKQAGASEVNAIVFARTPELAQLTR